jgi:hypothetical protein
MRTDAWGTLSRDEWGRAKRIAKFYAVPLEWIDHPKGLSLWDEFCRQWGWQIAYSVMQHLLATKPRLFDLLPEDLLPHITTAGRNRSEYS